jgi:hypothetical protein
MGDLILFFATNTETMMATSALKEAGISVQMVPRPSTLATSSNFCLRIAAAAERPAESVLRAARIALAGFVGAGQVAQPAGGAERCS